MCSVYAGGQWQQLTDRGEINMADPEGAMLADFLRSGLERCDATAVAWVLPTVDLVSGCLRASFNTCSHVIRLSKSSIGSVNGNVSIQTTQLQRLVLNTRGLHALAKQN